MVMFPSFEFYLQTCVLIFPKISFNTPVYGKPIVAIFNTIIQFQFNKIQFQFNEIQVQFNENSSSIQ